MTAKIKNRDSQPEKPVNVSPIIKTIIFLERLFTIISPAIEFFARLMISLYIAISFHPIAIVNLILIIWIFKPIIEEFEI